MTYRALVRLLSSVCAHVPVKITTSREATLAGFAFEWFFSCVSDQVPLKMATIAMTDTTLIKSAYGQLHLSPQRPSCLLLSTTPCLSSCLFTSIINASLLLVNCNELQVRVSHVHSTHMQQSPNNT